MDIALLETLQNELTCLEKEYKSLRGEFDKCGDIDIFADFENRLQAVKEGARKLPPVTEERSELIRRTSTLTNKIRALIHSA